MTINIHRFVDIISAVNDIVPAQLVGGAVRDIHMNRNPHDFDFVTALLPDEVEQRVIAAGRRPFSIGKRFGTIGFKVMVPDPVFVEVTTFRADGPGRHPEVVFTEDIHADLARRDFRMNAMTMGVDGRIFDPMHGRDDIDRRIISTVGNATLRFKEDPLRMLRLFRFESQLGMCADTAAFKSVQKHGHRILSVSKERWTQELDKLLMGQDAGMGLHGLWHSGLMKFIIPELAPQFMFNQHSRHHTKSLHAHTISVVEHTPFTPEQRWAALLHDVGKPSAQTWKKDDSGCNFVHHESIGAEMAESVCRRLRFSNDRTRFIVSAVQTHMEDGHWMREADKASR